MIPYIEDTKPVRPRLRIRNRIRFIVFLLLLLCTLLTIFIRKGASQAEYRPFKVGYGDTYWQIAKDLQEQGYRSRADIRDVVYELIQKSGIKAHELREGDTIYLPDLEGVK